MIAKSLLSDDKDTDPSFVAEFCFALFEVFKANRATKGMYTLRSFVRMINSSYLLRHKYSMSFPGSLLAAYKVTFSRQIKETDTWKSEIENVVQQMFSKFGELSEPNYLGTATQGNSEHVLTDTRKLQAEAVAACIDCNIPVLLEGPAAVGKTALVSFLSNNVMVKLERVNNTETTSVQDYLGSYLPFGEGFTFRKGALYRAMENGSYFLSDEFNLADPAVLNMLFPLLEGKGYIHIPGTDKIVEAHPNFRFFATQNDAKYANRHQLPVSLRNRFVEVQVNDFPQSELSTIIARRKERGKMYPKQPIPADRLAQFYHSVKNSPLNITMREVIKWIHRQALFEKQPWPLVGLSLLGQRFTRDSENYKQLLEQFDSVWDSAAGQRGERGDVAVTQLPDGVMFKEGLLSVTIPDMQLSNSFLWTADRAVPPESFLRALVRIAFAVKR